MEFLFYSETYKSLLQLAVASWSQFTNFQFSDSYIFSCVQAPTPSSRTDYV